MKYKLTGAVTLLLAVILLIGASVLKLEDTNPRYIQHRSASQTEDCGHTDSTFCTHLPLMEINTNDNEIIPGKAIVEDGVPVSYETTPDGRDEIIAKVEVTSEEGVNHHTEDTPTIESDVLIHVRGRTSRTFDKLGYSLEFINADGTDNDVALMGMDAHNEWALHGPYLDKTLIRNYMWYNIAGEIMDYAPNCRLFELFLNGEYMGVYLAVEKITAGENGARLELTKDAKDNKFYGYLLRYDSESDIPYKNINNFSTYVYMPENTISITYPKGINLDEEKAAEITRDFSAFEKALFSNDFDTEYGYERYIDVDSFVDYFLINELTINSDAGLRSTYLYRDLSNQYKMCVWDFDACSGNYIDDVADDAFFMDSRLWFSQLVKDEKFTERIMERYYELRETVFSEEYLMAFIDEAIAYLGPAIDRNYEKWGYVFDEDFQILKPKSRELHSFDEAVTQYKNSMTQRLAWMDINIEALKSDSAESAVQS